MSTDFFGDFCLACDRQTNGSTFCSQACRMAELELYTGSEPSSTVCNTSSPEAAQTQRSNASGFELPPAYNFTSHRQTSSTSLATSSSSLSSSSPPLSPKTTSQFSAQVQSDLRDYVGAFDKNRTILRRRVSMQ